MHCIRSVMSVACYVHHVCQLYYPGQKKEPCCWCIKSESCDIEESCKLIQLWNRKRTRLVTAATSRIDASQQNQTADSSISHDASPRWFSFFLARVVLCVHVSDFNILLVQKVVFSGRLRLKAKKIWRVNFVRLNFLEARKGIEWHRIRFRVTVLCPYKCRKKKLVTPSRSIFTCGSSQWRFILRFYARPLK